METKGDILIADDERLVLVSLADALDNAGYSVRMARNGEEALRLFADRRPDLVLLDVMMPKADGFTVCRKIRETDAETPVLFLTALEDEKSQLKGFGCGADDYIEKSMPESLLLARIAAALRRTQAKRACGGFAFGSWYIQATSFLMTRDDGAVCRLTDREIALLRLLATHSGEVLLRDFLINQCWGSDADVKDGVLSVAMSTLREKLCAEGEKILTVHGVGYVYRP